jgi:hypothetical protein
MANFAKLNENNVVLDIVSVADKDTSINGVEDEQTGIDFLTQLNGWSLWKKTSRNTSEGVHYQQNGSPSEDQSKAYRINYAKIGGVYDPQYNGFREQQPFQTWTLNTNTLIWEPPVTFPSTTIYTVNGTDKMYFIYWNEADQKWFAYDRESPAQMYDWNPTDLVWEQTT